MEFPLIVRRRLQELGLDQKDLASAAQVTESYISQLLAGRKSPPAPDRTDIYAKMEALLKLPAGRLATLAEMHHKEALKKKLTDPPTPLFKEVRELILRKCEAGKAKPISDIFEREPFGALEALVTRKLLEVVKRVAKEELEDENWLRMVARLSDRSYEQMRVIVLEFLDTDVLNLSVENCVTFLDPLIESWDIDLDTFAMEIVLNRRLAPGHPKKFEFVERDSAEQAEEGRGLRAFLEDPSFRCDATAEEIQFLRQLRFKQRRPTALYYYRELQNLRDPLHFRPRPGEKCVRTE